MQDFTAFYEDNGYLIQPGAFTTAQCDALIAAGCGLEAFMRGDARPAMMPHRTHSLFLDALKNPAIVEVVERLIGGKASGLQTEFFYCRPGTRGFSLHQDNFFVEAPAGAFVSAWIALTDVTPEKGGLIVYPGTHKAGLLPVRAMTPLADAGQDPNAGNEETVVPACFKPLTPSVPKGAALFIHGHLVHGSNANATNAWRYVLLSTYIRKGEPFRPGNYARREAVEV